MYNHRLAFIVLFIICFNFSFAIAQEDRNLLSKNYSENDIENSLVHEKSWIAYPKYNDRQAWNEVPRSLRTAYIKEGEQYIDYKWPNVNATDYLDFVRTGNRQIMEDPYNEKLSALEALVMAELMEGEGRFIDDIINGVWDFSEMTYWGNSAHLTLQKEGAGLPDVNEPTIDLGVGKVATDLAWIYHFFKEEFDKINPLISQRIKQEIERKVLEPYYTRNDFWWMGFNRDFVNNWNPWVNYNVLNCILLLEDDLNKKKKYVYKVMRSVDNFIDYYPTDGGSDEGPAYWNHAGGKLFDVLELLSRATNGKVDIFDEEVIGNIGRYIYRAYINDQYFINFADASNKIIPRIGVIYRYGDRINDPTMKGFSAFLAQQNNFGESIIDGKIELALENLFNLKEINTYSPKEPLIENFWLPTTQVAGVREKEGTTNGFYFAAKGGSNGESHNHNDVGSFILYYNGKPAIVDAGVGTYTKKTFSSQRYEIWTMRSLYHNLPVINGMEQSAGGEFKAKNTNFTDKDGVSTFNVEIAGAYPKEANINKWERTYTLDRNDNVFTINDDFDFQAVEGKTSLNFLISTEVEKISKDKVRLSGDDVDLTLQWNASQYDFEVEDLKLEDERLIKAWPNGLKRIILNRTSTANKDSSKIIVEVNNTSKD